MLLFAKERYAIRLGSRKPAAVRTLLVALLHTPLHFHFQVVEPTYILLPPLVIEG